MKSCTDEGISVATDGDLIDTLIEDVIGVIRIPCDLLLAAEEVLVAVLVGKPIVVVLGLEVITACVVVTVFDAEGEGNPLSKIISILIIDLKLSVPSPFGTFKRL